MTLPPPAPQDQAVPTPWITYAEKQPETAKLYRWRLPHNRLGGLVVEFAAQMRMRGAGYTQVLSPEFDRWDGYHVHVPKGAEWTESASETRPAIVGLTPRSCARCEQVPTVTGTERAYGGGVIGPNYPHTWNAWRLHCCEWSRTPDFEDPRVLIAEWNARNTAEPPAAPCALSWDDACRRIADDPSVSLTAYEVQELVRGAVPGAVETPLTQEAMALAILNARRRFHGEPLLATTSDEQDAVMVVVARKQADAALRLATAAFKARAPDKHAYNCSIFEYGAGCDCKGVSAPPSAERILTQATDVDDAVVLACAAEIAHEAACYSEVVAIIRKHFPARSGAAVVMPDAEDLYLEAYRMRRAALGHTSFRSDRESWRSGTDNKDLARDKKVIVESVNACLAEFRRLNPAPSTASASESEEK